VTERLDAVEAQAWEALRAGAEGAEAFRILTLATMGRNGWPEARSLVLRDVDLAARCLEFHTDIRSAKWEECAGNDRATVLGWDAESRQQLRLAGQVTRAGPDSEIAARAWAAQSKWNHLTYAGTAPATLLTDPSGEEEGEPEEGRANFGVLLFEALSLDWCQLERGNNRRAFFSYHEERTATWIAT
jgi:hypothetical protein